MTRHGFHTPDDAIFGDDSDDSDAEDARTDGGTTLEAEQRNGVYFLGVEQSVGETVVTSRTDRASAERIRINGRIIGVRGNAEIECDDYRFDGDTLHITMEGDRDE